MRSKIEGNRGTKVILGNIGNQDFWEQEGTKSFVSGEQGNRYPREVLSMGGPQKYITTFLAPSFKPKTKKKKHQFGMLG